MVTVNITTARARLREMIAEAKDRAVFIERHGEVEAVLVSPREYERMVQALEDAADITAFDAALAEEGDNIPWEQAKADLGW